ncbi:MAG: hypothetical protein M0P57_02320 [Syntrophales bacterium]|jgi:hypothetical protein|nr:hypothetical protein [Syntrophales bacterium]MDY0043336.1 hypothetical protein [Syntrophales bacterium]
MVKSEGIRQGLLQSNSIERIQHVQQQNPDMQQRQFQIELEKEKRRAKEKIQDIGKAGHAMIKEEEKERCDGLIFPPAHDGEITRNDLEPSDEIKGNIDVKV